MILVFLSFLTSLSFTRAVDPTYLHHFCSGTYFTANSIYQSNLELLLSSLASNATRNDGFSNITAGEDPEKFDGLFLCRGDVLMSTCRDCVTFASRDVTSRCALQKGAVIWYDECLLHYSNDESFLSTVETAPGISLVTAQNVSNTDGFDQLVWNLMTAAVNKALKNPKLFAKKKDNFGGLQTLYGLVQCTRDLSKDDCSFCLRKAILELQDCCSQRVGARVLYPSCTIRYEVYPFHAGTSTHAPAPSPLPGTTPQFLHPPIYLHHFCSGTYFTTNSIYQSNLELLLSSLASNTSRNNGFSNITVGEDPEKFDGLFLCRGDVSMSTCRDCVTFATRDVTSRCALQKGAVIWYDECLLHYSNDESFLSTVETVPGNSLVTARNVSNTDGFDQLVWNLMTALVNKALKNLKLFAKKNDNFGGFQTLYGLVQCTRDLSKDDCSFCLRKAIIELQDCCSQRVGGRVLYPSCTIWYEVYPFHAGASTHAPAPAPSPLPGTTPQFLHPPMC